MVNNKLKLHKLLFLMNIVLLLISLTGCLPINNRDNITGNDTLMQVVTQTIPPSSIEVTNIEFNDNNSYETRQTPTVNIDLTDIQLSTNSDFPNEAYYLIETLSGDIFIEDIFGKNKQVISKGGHFVQWNSNGCTLYFIDFDGNLVKKDLGEDQPTVIFSRKDLIQKVGPVFLGPGGFSFDESWIWFRQGEGNLIPGYDMGDIYSRLEKQNIMVVSTDLSGKAIQISKNKGGWIAAWSPTDLQIAYSDFDENQILQIYTTHINGNEIIQRTQFNNKSDISSGWTGLNISDLLWSPNGKRLGINYQYESNDNVQYFFMVIDIETNQKIYEQVDIRGNWWINDEQFVQTNIEKDIDLIEVYDLSNNSYITSIPKNHFERYPRIFPFIRNYWIGFLMIDTKELYIYNLKDHSFYQFPYLLNLDDIYAVSTTPEDFYSLETCNKK